MNIAERLTDLSSPLGRALWDSHNDPRDIRGDSRIAPQFTLPCTLPCNKISHFTNLSRSFCKCCLSPSVLTFLNSFVSSANFSMLLVILSSKSLIYITNNIGPNTDPSGTPLKTDFQFETSPSTTTRCLLSVSHCSIQPVMLSPIPWAFNLRVIFDVALCQKLSENLSR